LWGLGVPYTPTNAMLTYLYPLADGKLTTPAKLLPKPYFNDKELYTQYFSQWDPYSKTHTSRVWSDDFNHDGLPDLVLEQEIWDGAHGLQKMTLQMLQNEGAASFADVTDASDPDYDMNVASDYSLRMADVDGSGIASWLIALPGFCAAAQQATCQPRAAFYILVNDGSGRMHVAMHDEALNLGLRVIAFAAKEIQKIPGAYINPDPMQNSLPAFVAYQTPSG